MSTEDGRAPAVELRDVWKGFGTHTVLRGLSLAVRDGEVLVIIGPSGGGKSTILRCIAGLERVDRGEVLLQGAAVQHPSRRRDREEAVATRDAQRQVGMVFQQYNLFPHMTVLANVTLALRHVRHLGRDEAITAATTELHGVGLADHMDKYPDELSGGQQQRVAIARALALQPRVMLFDEVTSALDPELVGDVLRAVRVLADGGMTLVVVTHEMDFARQVADRVAFIDEGAVVESGAPATIFARPAHERTRAFLARLLER